MIHSGPILAAVSPSGRTQTPAEEYRLGATKIDWAGSARLRQLAGGLPISAGRDSVRLGCIREEPAARD